MCPKRDPRDRVRDNPEEPCSLFEPLWREYRPGAQRSPDDPCPTCELYHPDDEPCDVDVGLL